MYTEHNQNPQWRSKIKKDPGIPNLFPYKDKILQEIEEKRRIKDEETARRRELAKEQRDGGEAVMDTLEDNEDIAEQDDLLDEESDAEDSMQVVSYSCWSWSGSNAK